MRLCPPILRPGFICQSSSNESKVSPIDWEFRTLAVRLAPCSCLSWGVWQEGRRKRETDVEGRAGRRACGRFPELLLHREVSINCCRVNEFDLRQETEESKFFSVMEFGKLPFLLHWKSEGCTWLVKGRWEAISSPSFPNSVHPQFLPLSLPVLSALSRNPEG